MTRTPRLVGALLALPVVAAAQVYTVAGTVVDARNRSPIARVRVTLSPESSRNSEISVVTGSDGAFSFGAPEGKFRMYALKGGVREIYGMVKPEAGLGSLIITGPNLDTSHLSFQWFPTSSISGRVTSQEGEPLVSALIQLVRETVSSGKKVVGTAGYTRTNDLGEYRFGPVAAGMYYLVATGQPWYADTFQQLANRFRADDPQVAALNAPPIDTLLPEYYSNTTDARGAAPLRVRPGDELRADFTMLVAVGRTLTVKLDPPTARGTIGLVVEGVGGTDAWSKQLTAAGAAAPLMFSGVPPGQYKLRFSGGGSDVLYASQDVQMGGNNQSVELKVGKAPSVSGKVTYRDGVKSSGAATVSLVHMQTGFSLRDAVKEDGTYQVSVTPGRYYVLATAPGGFTVASFEVDGAKRTDDLIEVGLDAKVSMNVVLSNDTGRVKGYTMKKSVPSPESWAILAPTHSASPMGFRSYQAESDASFDFQNIPAGDYILFATDDAGLEYTNPEVIKPYLPYGKSIRIESHNTLDERIEVAPDASAK